MPYDPFERDDLRGRRRREPEAKKGKRLVLGGLLLMIAPFMILFFVTAGARVSYTDERESARSLVELQRAQLRRYPQGPAARQRYPSCGSLGACGPVDYLVYVFVAIGIVVLLGGLFKMTPRR